MVTTRRAAEWPDEIPSSGRDVRESPLEVRPPTPDAKCVESPLSSLDAAITPTSHFFVRSHFAVPHIDLDSWRLVIEGAVERPFIVSYSELQALPHEDIAVLLECAGNSRSTVRPRPEGVLWRNGAVGTARWKGVPMGELLRRAGVQPGAVEVMLEGADHGREPGAGDDLTFAHSIPIEKALDPATLLADAMNGEPLSPNHGFPVRALVPGWYGMVSVKWLSRIVVLREPFQGYYRTRAYAFIPEGDPADTPKRGASTIRVKSLITSPREGQVLPPGPVTLRGVAWSGSGAITRVEVSTDPAIASGEQGTWLPAQVQPGESAYAWSHWQVTTEMRRPGFYVLRVRAADDQGHGQPAEAQWNFRGLANNSIHSIPVEIRAPSSPPP